ncbi:MAG: hypothetical protein M3552_16610 [Planctomycetota bacterium]|nr:hypothetical protein [Planctomycetaceae bacterium]MDQ3332245.1 hypothetical protein [Planctomycetota bacterium]
MSQAGRANEPLRFVITPDGELFGRESEEGRELVRRIHACFFACEGITTDELERGIVADMRRVIEEVQPFLHDRVKTSDAA